MAAVEAPREHLAIDAQSLVENLASCKRGSTQFRLNAQAFSAVVSGVGPAIIDKALENVDIRSCWDGIGGSADLEHMLGTKGARATGERARDQIQELWRLRNHIAHGGDEEIVLAESQLHEAIDFVGCFCEALDSAVAKQLKAS